MVKRDGLDDASCVSSCTSVDLSVLGWTVFDSLYTDAWDTVNLDQSNVSESDKVHSTFRSNSFDSMKRYDRIKESSSSQ